MELDVRIMEASWEGPSGLRMTGTPYFIGEGLTVPKICQDALSSDKSQNQILQPTLTRRDDNYCRYQHLPRICRRSDRDVFYSSNNSVFPYI